MSSDQHAYVFTASIQYAIRAALNLINNIFIFLNTDLFNAFSGRGGVHEMIKLLSKLFNQNDFTVMGRMKVSKILTRL